MIVAGEYLFGLKRSRRADLLLPKFLALQQRSAALEVTLETAAQYADVREELFRIGRPISVNDVWIAALARQHQLSVASKDQHFDSVAGVSRVAW